MTDQSPKNRIRVFIPDRRIVTSDRLPPLEEMLFASVLQPEMTIKQLVESNGLPYREIPFGETTLGVVSQFPFYKSLKKARTPSSGAYYLLWHEEIQDGQKQGFFLQYLPPNAVTSRHFHTEQTEIFHLLEGNFSLETSEGTFPLAAGESYTVNPGVIHQLRTGADPSFTVIEIQNVNYRDHQLVE